MDTIYCTFIDKKGRTIEVGLDGNDIVAEDSGDRIATWTFDQREEDGKDFLGVVDMDAAYERAGIGVQMLIAAEEYYSNFPMVGHFTEEGAAFFNGCKAKGISKFDHDTFEDDRY